MTEPQRLHFSAAFIAIAKNLPYFFLLIFLGVQKAASGESTEFMIESLSYAVIGFIVLFLGVVRWWRFRYWIEDGEFRVVSGVLVQKRVFIPFENIRTVEVNQHLMQRLFSVVRLQIKTGATGTQADLLAIGADEAKHLQMLLQREPVASTVERAAVQTKRRITLLELIISGATSGQVGVVVAVGGWLLNETAAFALQPILERVEGMAMADMMRIEIIVIGVLLMIAGLVVTFFTSILATAVRYGGFTVSLDDDTLVIEHGLINRQTIRLPLNRVQAVRYVQNPVRELIGTGALYVEAIGHAEEKGASSELFPLLEFEEVDGFLREFLPEFAGVVDVQRPPARALVRFLLVPTLLTALVASIVAWSFQPWGATAFFALIPVIAMRLFAWRHNGIGTAGELAQIETRSLFVRQMTWAPRRAVRSVSSRWNIFQSRRQLANLTFTIASGATGKKLGAVNLDEEVADALLSWRAGATRPS